jgi:hypothetical protein
MTLVCVSGEQKQATQHVSAASFKADVSQVWTQHRSMRKPSADHPNAYEPKLWTELDPRWRSVVSRGLRDLLLGPDKDTEYIMSELRKLYPSKRKSIMRQFITESPNEMKAILREPEIADLLDIAIIRLDKASAASLFLSLDMRLHQWETLAKALNALLPKGEKYIGGVLPNSTTLIAWLRQVGARLQFEDVIPVDVDLESDVGVIDLAGLSDDSDDEGEAPKRSDDDSNNCKVRGYFVKNAMQRAIAPELIAINRAYPGSLSHWKQHGIDIAIAADGTSVVRFNGRSWKLEIGAAKIISPFAGADSAQQASYLGIPLFIHDGEECYTSLRASLARMFREGHLRAQVTVTLDGKEVSIPVRWHLCADFKMVSLVTGLGGAAAARPCFLCMWARADPLKAAAQRNLADATQHAEWVTEFLKPILAAEVSLKEARQALKRAGAGQTVGGKRKVVPEIAEQRAKEAADAVQAAYKEREEVVASVKGAISKLPDDHPMIMMWKNAVWLQAQRLDLPQTQFDNVNVTESDCMKRLHAAVQGAWQYAQTKLADADKLAGALEELRLQEGAMTAYHRQTPDYDRLMSKIDATERELDDEVQAAAEAETSFAQICCEVNLEHNIVVHTQRDRPVKLLLPHPRPLSLSMSALKRLLNETCKSVQEEDLLKDFIPMERRWIEGLHLCLNTGNGAFELARNVLSFLLEPSGQPKDRGNPANGPENFIMPVSGSIQPAEFRQQGFDLQLHIEKVFGPKMKLPLTKFHGSQVEVLLKQRD